MKAQDLLTDLTNQVNLLVKAVTDQLLHLPNETLNAKDDGAWSILECIEHLNRYNAFYLQKISTAVLSAGDRKDELLGSTWIGQKSVAMMHPSNAKRQKTFRKMDPMNSRLDRTVLDRFLLDQRRLLDILNKAAFVNVNAKKVPVEFFRLVKMTIAEGLEFVVVHEQRHINQALAIPDRRGKYKTSGLVI